jgi:hypothetical protein
MRIGSVTLSLMYLEPVSLGYNPAWQRSTLSKPSGRTTPGVWS